MPHLANPRPQTATATERSRLLPVMHLTSGEAVILFAETEKRFEERAVFGPAVRTAECSVPATPAEWLATRIEAVANDAHNRTVERPVIVPMPLAALIHPDTAMACDAAIARTRLCPQEICLEIEDAVLSLPAGESAQSRIEALRRRGFRVSLNASRSWQSPLSQSLRLLLDSLRVDARKIDDEPELQARIEAAAYSGMSVIAENAKWRDCDYLADIGVEYGFRMRADG